VVLSLLAYDLGSLDMLVLKGLPKNMFNPNFNKFPPLTKSSQGVRKKRRYAPIEWFRALQIVEYGLNRFVVNK